MRFFKLTQLFLVITILACDSDDGINIPTRVNQTPTANTYNLPENQRVCVGVFIEEDLIEVTFDWDAFEDTDGTIDFYELHLAEQGQSETVIVINETSASKTLKVGTNYNWSIVGVDNEGGATEGALWRFTTPQRAQVNHIPKIALLVMPQKAIEINAGEVIFEWLGGDEDEGETDQLKYDFICKNHSTNTDYDQSQLEVSNLKLTLDAGSYTWGIRSIDPQGNTSLSNLQPFLVID